MITEKDLLQVTQSRVLSKLKVLQMKLDVDQASIIIGIVKSDSYINFLTTLERVADEKDEDFLKQDAFQQYSPIIRAEVYAGIADMRFLTGMIAIEEDFFSKEILLKRIKQLTEEKKRRDER